MRVNPFFLAGPRGRGMSTQLNHHLLSRYEDSRYQAVDALEDKELVCASFI